MPVFRGRLAGRCVLAAGVLLALALVFKNSSADDSPQPVEKTHSKVPAKSNEKVHNPFPRRVKAPEDLFAGNSGWLNVSGPIELRDLRGKVVLLDFWTYCCINCMHILPDLKYLEQKYPRELVVIGVHSAKFDNEKDSENIRRAILRYEIKHPVVNDSHLAVWNRAGARAWPTFAIIDPEGKFVGSRSGEGQREILDAVIGKLVAYHRATGTLDESPLKLGLEQLKHAASPLKFPGKILADERGGRLFIADSNHNRIVIATAAGKLIDVAGTGEMGAKDGPFASARFDHPQGMALEGANLYVADTENHLLRVLDLEKKTVATLAGTGVQDAQRGTGGKLRETPLNSPWDLLLVNRTLYVAMAGAQQIWSHVLGSDTIGAWAGNGREDVVNGPREEAAFAQPSGLTTDGDSLFVADSEGSAIRKLPRAQGEPVSTLAGTSDLENGRSLFEFGDLDGVGSNARFQHPLAVAYADGRIFVADTYNHKIKVVTVQNGDARTWLGNGTRGDSVEPARFSEPGGVSIAGGMLYIADTNNHAIKVADLKTGKVTVLTIDGLTPPVLSEPRAEVADDERPSASANELPTQRVAAGDALKIEISFKLPVGCELNKLAPARCRLQVHKATELFRPDDLAKSRPAAVDGAKAVVTIPLAARSGKALVDVSLSFTYCRDGVGGLCKLGSAKWKVPIEVAADAKQAAVPLVAEVGQN